MKHGSFKQYVEELRRYDAALSDTHFGWELIGEGAIYSHSTERLVVQSLEKPDVFVWEAKEGHAVP